MRHLLGHLVGARGKQHAQHHVVRGARLVVTEVLLDQLGDAVADLVGETQPRTVVNRLLAINPANRYPDMVAVIDDLMGLAPRRPRRACSGPAVSASLKIV